MRPVCVKCEREMRCEKNGIRVGGKEVPTWVRYGDKFKCPSCGFEIVVGFGEAREELRHGEILV